MQKSSTATLGHSESAMLKYYMCAREGVMEPDERVCVLLQAFMRAPSLRAARALMREESRSLDSPLDTILTASSPEMEVHPRQVTNFSSLLLIHSHTEDMNGHLLRSFVTRCVPNARGPGPYLSYAFLLVLHHPHYPYEPSLYTGSHFGDAGDAKTGLRAGLPGNCAARGAGRSGGRPPWLLSRSQHSHQPPRLRRPLQ